jgi:flagellar P-ring protein precursor FlgI
MLKNLIVLSLIFTMHNTYAQTQTRLKDLVFVKGVRENSVIGYGLVIGLNGTGDGGGEITNASLKKMYQRLGLDPQKDISSKNVASVVVSANLPPFARLGQKVDIKIASIGDASSLSGGTLLVTPLKGGDGKIYAIASGSVSIGGIKTGEKFPTSGLIPDGATVEADIETDFDKKTALRFALKSPDFTTAARIEKIINMELGGKYASAKDAGTVDLMVPPQYQRKVVSLLATIENFRIERDAPSKIVINERTGTIVAGGEIEVKPVAISHGDLTIEIAGEGSSGNSKKKGDSLYYMDKKTTLSDLVKGLNAYGIRPDDLISILQALKRNGALTGDIEML